MEFNLIYKKYYKTLFNYIYHYTHNTFMTKDILQESFIKFWKKYNKKNIENNELLILKKICKNTTIDFLRKEKKYPSYKNSDEDFQISYENQKLEILHSEMFEKINLIASSLKNEELRQLYFLLLDSKKNKKEIAKSMKISERHLRRKIKQLFKLIREELENNIENETSTFKN